MILSEHNMAHSKPQVKLVKHSFEDYEVTKAPITHVLSPVLPAFVLQPPKFKREC